MAETKISFGGIEVIRVEPRLIVTAAPDRALITLEVLAYSSPDRLFVSGDTLYLGSDRDRCEVSYRVVGWDAEAKALIVERLTPDPEEKP